MQDRILKTRVLASLGRSLTRFQITSDLRFVIRRTKPEGVIIEVLREQNRHRRAQNQPARNHPNMNLNQRKIKGQQLKGKIVSEFFTLVRTFFTLFTLFQNFSPQDFPLQNKGFQLNENKREEKIIKITGQIDVAR